MLQNLSQRPSYRWWVFGALALGTFLTVTDFGSLLVALPAIESYFGSDLPTVQWVVLGNTLVISVLLLPMGKLGDMVGRKRVYVGGFIIFVIAAALAGASFNLPMLIASKTLQGIGSAMIQGTSMATLVTVFPERERGRALGTQLSVMASGIIAGTAVGGLLVSVWGWQYIFFANVPVGVISILVSILVLPDDRRRRGVPSSQPTSRFDWIGAALWGGSLVAFLLTIGLGNRVGWTSTLIFACGGGAVVLLAVFVWWELRVAFPMLELRLFQSKLVALGSAANWATFMGISGSWFLLPFYLQKVLEYSPRQVGLIMVAPAVCMVLIGPISGVLSDKLGWQKLTVGGLTLGALAWFGLALGLVDEPDAIVHPLALVIPMMVLQSLGTGLFFSPNNSSIISAVARSQYGMVSALTQVIRNIANVTSVALATTVVVVIMGSKGVEPSLAVVSPDTADAFLAGLRWAFFMIGAALALGVGMCVIRGERAPAIPPATELAEAKAQSSD